MLYLCFVCSGLPPARCVMIPSFAAFTLKTENKEEQAKQLPDLLSVPLYVRTYVRVCVLCILPSPLPTAFNRTNTARLLWGLIESLNSRIMIFSSSHCVGCCCCCCCECVYAYEWLFNVPFFLLPPPPPPPPPLKGRDSLSKNTISFFLFLRFRRAAMKLRCTALHFPVENAEMDTLIKNKMEGGENSLLLKWNCFYLRLARLFALVGAKLS